MTTHVDQHIIDLCLDQAGTVAFRAVGFRSDDLTQDAREAMIAASRTYEDGHGCAPRTYMMNKARWHVIDVHRDTHRSRRTVTATPEPLTVGNTPGAVDPGYTEVDDVLTNGAVLNQRSVDAASAGCSVRDRSIINGWLHGEVMAVAGARVGVTESRVCQVVGRFKTRFVRQAGGHR